MSKEKEKILRAQVNSPKHKYSLFTIINDYIKLLTQSFRSPPVAACLSPSVCAGVNKPLSLSEMTVQLLNVCFNN